MIRSKLHPRLFVLAAFVVLTLATTSCQRSQRATIVVDFGKHASADAAGHDEAQVDWAEGDSRDATICTSCFAACELQHYLRMVTRDSSGFVIADDDSLPAGDLILVGGPDDNQATASLASELGLRSADLATRGPEGYIIRSTRQGSRRVLILAGGGRVGTLYGVYDFLQRIGVRWLAPGLANEDISFRQWSDVPRLSVQESPAFVSRGFHAWEDRGDQDFILWMGRNRLNYWCVEEHERPLLHKLGIALVAGGHGLTARYLDPRAPYPYSHARFPTKASLPLDPYPVSSEFKGDANADGQLSRFEAHPEWYGLRGGVRRGTIVDDRGDNFCISNEGAMTEWLKNALEDLSVGPYREADILNAWMLDGGRWCSCQRCRALGTPTDRTLYFVHRIDREIKAARAAGRIRRPITLSFLAYTETANPPTRPLPRDFDYGSCVAVFYPITRCYAHPFSESTCDVNADYNARLRGWTSSVQRHYRGRVALGEYYNRSGYKSLPLCFMDVMKQDIPYYASLGIRSLHYMHCKTRDWGNTALTNWQMAHQLWNPRVNCATLWNDYFTRRYGAAGPSMRRAYGKLEEMLSNVGDLKYGLARRLQEGIEPLFVDNHLSYAGGTLSLTHSLRCAAACRNIFDDVLGQTLPDRIHRRVVEDNRLFSYGERTLRLYDALSQASTSLRSGDQQAAQQAVEGARMLANALKADTTSTRFSSSHANATNALVASGVSGVAERFASDLARVEARSSRIFNPRQQPLVLRARDFDGGSMVAGTLSDLLRRVGWQGADGPLASRRLTPSDQLSACFVLAGTPERDLHLTLTGFRPHRPGHPATRAAVLVNGHLVAAGQVPLSEGRQTAIAIALPTRVLERGMNRIQVLNLERNDDTGDRAWFSISRAELAEVSPARELRRFACRGPQDLSLTYTSIADSSEQRYRIFLPSAYDGRTPLPMLVALHGTGGSENSFFDDSSYGRGSYIREAEKRGLIVVCPNGRGDTEYRGIGELDVLQVIDRVKSEFCVDEDRVVCSGFSMGGTGTTYLVMRHPDLFAAGVALSSCYEHVNMLENLRHVPMLYIQGAYDWRIYASEGPLPITRRLAELGYSSELWMLPRVRHNTMRSSTARLMDWVLEQRRVRDPEHVTFTAYLPHQGRGYWTEIMDIARPGALAKVDARVAAGNHITLRAIHVRRVVIRPSPRLVDLARPIFVTVNGAPAFAGDCSSDQSIVCAFDGGRWRGSLRPVEHPSAPAYHGYRLGTVTTPPTQDGIDETSMGNWMADMMRSVSGADVAIYNRRDYRGVRLRPGRTLFTEDLYDWIRPYDRRLCTFRCTGRDLIEILEANLLDLPEDRERIVQVSGCRYAFDRRRKLGDRIVSTTLDPAQSYTVVCEGQVLNRETILLAGRFGQLLFDELEPTAVSAAWQYIDACGGEIRVGLQGRVQDLTPRVTPQGERGDLAVSDLSANGGQGGK